MKISAVLLAGGFSSRMGCEKAELDFHGVNLIQHQVNKLRDIGIEDIVIAGYANSLEGTRFAPDIFPHCGPLSGIHTGLIKALERSALVLAVDTPLIPLEHLSLLIKAHTGGITLTECDGKLEPLIGVYDKNLANTCGQILRSEHTSVRELFRLTDPRVLHYDGDPRMLMNCNTPEEYERMLFFSQQTSVSVWSCQDCLNGIIFPQNRRKAF